MDQNFKEGIRRIVQEEIAKARGIHNSLLTADGKIAEVASDGLTCTAYINGSEIATPGILNPQEIALSPNEEVVVFNRSEQDRIVLYKKMILTS